MINKPVDLIFTYLLSYILYAYKVTRLVPVVNTLYSTIIDADALVLEATKSMWSRLHNGQYAYNMHSMYGQDVTTSTWSRLVSMDSYRTF